MVVLQGRIDVVVVEAQNLLNLDHNILRPADKSDPYCVVDVDGAAGSLRIGKTFTIDDCLSPKWYYKLSTELRQDVSGIRFIVKDKDLLSSEVIGTCYLPVTSFIGGRSFEGKLNLQNSAGGFAGSLCVSVCYSGSESVGGEVTFHDKARVKAGDLKGRVTRAIPWSTGDLADSFVGEMAFLHGALDICIERAANLPNLDSSILSFQKKDVSDPYVVVTLEDAEGGSWKVATTRVIDNNLNPVWNETFRADVCHHVTAVTFTVRDKDFVSSEKIGSVTFTAESLLSVGELSGMFDLLRDRSNKKGGQLMLSIRYIGKHMSLNEPEVPECLFPLRHNNRVTLYQDAHCPHLPLEFTTAEGGTYCPESTWRDLYQTITNAQKFIFIIGWSVSAKISLLRWGGEDTRTLGEILLEKAYHGLKVRLLLWDELTSNDLRKTGAMSTEDEETANFFKGTPVVVILAPRDRYSKDMFSTKNPFTKLCYTHHQKCVITDVETPGAPGQRHVVAFVGGLDLTGGRFDTPEHPLFRTLVQEHRHDFRNKMISSTSASGPREPWHDIHSRIEGPVAVDVLANFQERWAKQGDHEDNPVSAVQNDPSIFFDYMPSDPDNWSVQVFRSINSDSAIFNWQVAIAGALANKKGRAFDNSIHRAYIHQIRRAQHLIYVENQYFLGSSHFWHECRDAKAGNLVPLEIAARIEDKILAGERFAAYIVIPMFPEGRAADKVTQEILHWQHRTMQMMYGRIGAAIQKAGINAHPQDYLLFLCLVKKEPRDTVPPELVPPEDPTAAAAFTHRRLMIYVHSKMAIFDDEYIIIGSANINDRSLSGNRDTEIAIGAYQPHHMGSGRMLARGAVCNFRRGLWAEHMGPAAPVNMDPVSQECIALVRQLGEETLITYRDDDTDSTPRHLMVYPLLVNADGSVTARPDFTTFPDTVASVVGARSKVFPSSLTT